MVREQLVHVMLERDRAVLEMEQTMREGTVKLTAPVKFWRLEWKWWSDEIKRVEWKYRSSHTEWKCRLCTTISSPEPVKF